MGDKGQQKYGPREQQNTFYLRLITWPHYLLWLAEGGTRARQDHSILAGTIYLRNQCQLSSYSQKHCSFQCLHILSIVQQDSLGFILGAPPWRLSRLLAQVAGEREQFSWTCQRRQIHSLTRFPCQCRCCWGLFADYLADRRQCVVLDGVLSSPSVPHEPILDPLFFLLAVNPLCDLSISNSEDDIVASEASLNTSVSIVSNCC